MDETTREVSILNNRGRLLGRLAAPEPTTVGLGELLTQLLVISPDRILVPDIANDRALLFHKSTRSMVQEVRLPRQAGFADHWAATRSGHLYVSTMPVPIHKFVLEPESIFSHLSAVSELLSATATLTVNLMSDNNLKPVVKLDDRRKSIPIFSPGIIWDAVSDGRIVVADGHRRILAYYSPGGELLEERLIPLEPSMISAAERAWLLKRVVEAHGLSEPPSFLFAGVDSAGPQFTALRVDDRDRVWLRKPASIASLHEVASDVFPDVLRRGSSQWVCLNASGLEPIEATFPSDFELTRVRGAFAYGFRVVGLNERVPARFHIPEPLG